MEHPGRPLAAMRRWQAPNVIVFSRANRPPVPFLHPDDEAKKSPPTVEAVEGTKREIRGLSVKSSLNISRLLSMLDWRKNGRCLHVSLSYNGHLWPKGPEALRLEKQAISMALSRCDLVDLSGVWILEFQSRENHAEKRARLAAGVRRQRGQGGSIKVPHWHFLLWIGDLDEREFEDWLRKWWAKFSGNVSEFGVCITSGDQGRSAWYLAMHAAKRAQPPPFPCGRMWGYINRDKVLGASDLNLTGEVEERERVWVARLYRRGTGCKTRNHQGLSWFLPLKWQWAMLAWVRDHVERERITRHRGGKPPF